MSEGMEVVDVVDRWLWERLTGDTALMTATGGRITGDEYPDNWPSPLVTWSMSSTRDVLGVGAVRIGVHSVYTVKAIGEGFSYADLAPIMTRVDQLLHNVASTTAYGHVESHREGTVRYAEGQKGSPLRHLGALYRIHAAT